MRKILKHPKIVKLYKEVKDMLRLVIESENQKDQSEDQSSMQEFVSQIQTRFLPKRFDAFHKLLNDLRKRHFWLKGLHAKVCKQFYD